MENVMSDGGLIIGIDIQENISQLCIRCGEEEAPKQVSAADGSPAAANPVPLSEWRLGGNLKEPGKAPKEPVGSLKEPGKATAGLGGENFENICRFLALEIETAKKAAGRTRCEKICITSASFEIDMLDFLTAAMDRLGFSREQWCVISHEESFAYYAYSQKRELYHPGVLLLDYTGGKLAAYLMASGIIKNREIIMENRYFLESERIKACVEKKLSPEDVEEDIINWLKGIFSKHIAAAVYLTGEGFDTDKFPGAFTKYLCSRRKVFAGQNLYAKGAVLCACSEADPGRFENTVLACSNRITTGIEADIFERGRGRRLRIIKPGINWYGASRKMDFIIEDIRQINLYMVPCGGGADYTEQIDISAIPYRKGKMTRIELEIVFMSDSVFKVTVRDKGFGDFVKSSGKVIEKTISLR